MGLGLEGGRLDPASELWADPTAPAPVGERPAGEVNSSARRTAFAVEASLALDGLSVATSRRLLAFNGERAEATEAALVGMSIVRGTSASIAVKPSELLQHPRSWRNFPPEKGLPDSAA